MDLQSENDALTRGLHAGDYASAYVSEDLEEAWKVEWDEVGEEMEEHEALYRAAFVLGFFGSYETDEVSCEYVEELSDAYRYADRIRALGLVVEERNEEENEEESYT